LRSRAKELHELPEGPLFFGRLDFVGRGPGHHIGRLRISTHPAAPPLVVDWRAPVSRAFYQAGTHDPQGVAIRRRFGWAIARRVRFGSLTVLGDLAQGTTPWAARSWPLQLAHLGKPDATVVPLTVGFRVPGAVLALADRLLDRLGTDVPRARSLRRDGALRIRHADGAADPVATVVREALAHEGSVGVVAADAEASRVREALDAAGLTPSPRITVIPATLVKGLEYDHVVAVEPAAIAEAEPRGLNRLYVVLTRAVSRLDVVHARALPW
jgi:hypothetical protein